MAIKNSQKGFALLVAVIFMSVMLSFALTLGSLGYKQQVLASSAKASQYAFYAADAGLECVLYADQQTTPNPFLNGNSGSFNCAGLSSTTLRPQSRPMIDIWQYTKSEMRLNIDGNRCADVTVYKPDAATTTYLFSQGYDVTCSEVNGSGRYASRGLQVH